MKEFLKKRQAKKNIMTKQKTEKNANREQIKNNLLI